MLTKERLLRIINDFLNEKSNEQNIPDYEKIREYIILEISGNNLFSKEFLNIYFLIKGRTPENSAVTESLIKKLLSYLDMYKDKPEYLWINDSLFLLEIIDDNFKKGFIDYCKRLFKFVNSEYIVAYDYDMFLSSFLKKLNDNNMVFEIINEITAEDFFMGLKYKERIMIITWMDFLYQYLVMSEQEKLSRLWKVYKRVLNTLINGGYIRDVMYLENIIYTRAIHGVENLTEDFIKIEDDISKPCRDLYKKWIDTHELKPCKKNLTKNSKKKIAIVRPTITFWSPFKLEYSLCKNLLNDKDFTDNYELYFYSMTLPDFGTMESEKKCIELLSNLGVEVKKPVEKYLSQGLFANRQKLVLEFREKLIEDSIDIIIYSDHFYSVGEFLFLSRTAPKQIYWCHQNHEVDFEGIDKRIIHYPPPFDSRFKEKFELFELYQDEMFLKGEEEKFKKEAEKIRKRFPENTIILGSIGRLLKVDNYDYLFAVSEILKRNPDTVYLACGTGNTKSIKKKIEKLGITDRFLFEGFVNPKVYRYVIDIYLNTFPFHSGEAIREFQSKEGEAFIVSLQQE